MQLGKRLFAWFYHAALSDKEPDLGAPLTREVRVPLLTQVRGDVLELGAGDGGNLPYYPAGINLTLLEPNPYLFRYLQKRSADFEFSSLKLTEGYGESLPFPDESFDSVVSMHVLCSVADQRQVLSEVVRVLRPGGRFLFMEHVAAPQNSGLFRFQRLVNPVWKTFGDGCHLTRRTGDVINTAGFSHVEMDTFGADGFPSLVGPHVAGVAIL